MRLNQLLLDTKGSLEHPVYHPEVSLNRHILLVTLRCWLLTNDINVTLAGLLHDLWKPQDGSMVDIEEGSYWSNPDHATQIADEIDSGGDLAHFIHQIGGNRLIVSDICRRHMSIKEGITKKSRHIPHIQFFMVADDMVGRHEFGTVTVPSLLLPGHKYPIINAEVTFCGQSPIQISGGSSKFTLTVDRFPHQYHFSVIPQIIRQFNIEIAKKLEILI